MQCWLQFTDKSTLNKMILEVTVLNVIPEKTTEFEAGFKVAQEIISSMKGWRGHQLQKCLEAPNRYILLVHWENLEDHTIGFRESLEYLQWKKLLHHFYSPFPVVEHFAMKFEKSPK
jgi:heme-degrading monooxygenase HmoA